MKWKSVTGLDTVQLRFTKTALAAVLSRDYRGTGNGSKRLLGDQHSNQAGGKGDLNHFRGGVRSVQIRMYFEVGASRIFLYGTWVERKLRMQD